MFSVKIERLLKSPVHSTEILVFSYKSLFFFTDVKITTLFFYYENQYIKLMIKSSKIRRNHSTKILYLT